MTSRPEPASPGDLRASGVPTEYFRRMYAESDDPWGFGDRWYEARKYDITMALLPAPHYGTVLELGSSVGVLSERLAARCSTLVCLELEPRAAESARVRLADVAEKVSVRVADIADGLPADPVDLIVASEVLYYLGDDALRTMTEALDLRRRAGVTILAAHWRHEVPEYPWTGDEVHERLRAALGAPQATYVDSDVVVDVFTPPDTPSVARAGGLV